MVTHNGHSYSGMISNQVLAAVKCIKIYPVVGIFNMEMVLEQELELNHFLTHLTYIDRCTNSSNLSNNIMNGINTTTSSNITMESPQDNSNIMVDNTEVHYSHLVI